MKDPQDLLGRSDLDHGVGAAVVVARVRPPESAPGALVERERERDKRLRALGTPRGPTLGYIGGADQDSGARQNLPRMHQVMTHHVSDYD